MYTYIIRIKLSDIIRVVAYLAGILPALRVAGADHALRDVEVAMFEPLVAKVSVQHRHLHFVHCRLVF